ncbi:MAG: DUF523 and DUF1722 domain-containing protein [Candidatus Paceibacterota bacterium]
MSDFAEPTVVVSSCLEFKKVRYDGQVVPCDIVRDLKKHVKFVKVCPEYEIGLGVPREPIRIVRKENEDKLVQPETGRDVTEEMDEFTEKFLDDLPEVDGFLFKSKSPTVGLRRIKKYSSETEANVVEKGAGFFARKIIDRYDGYPMEDNDRLRNDKIRNHFLTKLFTFSDFRSSVRSGKYADLKRFHERNRLLFKLYDPDILDSMDGKLEKSNTGERIIGEYFDLMKKAFSRGFVSKNFEKLGNFLLERYTDDISEEEIQHIEEILNIYKENKIGPLTVLSIFKNLALRFEDQLVLKQTVFEPFPSDLRPQFYEDRDRNFWKND